MVCSREEQLPPIYICLWDRECRLHCQAPQQPASPSHRGTEAPPVPIQPLQDMMGKRGSREEGDYCLYMHIWDMVRGDSRLHVHARNNCPGLMLEKLMWETDMTPIEGISRYFMFQTIETVVTQRRTFVKFKSSLTRLAWTFNSVTTHTGGLQRTCNAWYNRLLSAEQTPELRKAWRPCKWREILRIRKGNRQQEGVVPLKV